MSDSKKLSLLSAIFININIMLGTGVFINTVLLAQKVGAFSGLLYVVGGGIMLPLILSISRLMRTHPEGNFYTFGAALHPLWGFISSWIYFVGKLASASLGIHVFNMFLQKVIPFFSSFNILFMDSIIITLFVGLNLLQIQTGSRIQLLFLFTKMTPLLFAIIYGLHYAQYITIQAPHIIWSDFSVALPL